MDSNTKWRSIEFLANDSSTFSADLLKMKKLHDQLQSSVGVWSNVQDTVHTMNTIKEYKEHAEVTEGRIVNIIISGTSVPYNQFAKKKA